MQEPDSKNQGVRRLYSMTPKTRHTVLLRAVAERYHIPLEDIEGCADPAAVSAAAFEWLGRHPNGPAGRMGAERHDLIEALGSPDVAEAISVAQGQYRRTQVYAVLAGIAIIAVSVAILVGW